MAIKQNGSIFDSFNKEFKSDREIVTYATRYNSFYFRYASKSLKRDKKFILKFLRDGLNITEYMDRRLKYDKAFIDMCIREMGFGLKYGTAEQRKDKKLILETLALSDDIFWDMDSSLREDVDFLLEILERYPETYRLMTYKILENEKIKEQIDKIKHPLWKKIFNPLTILLFGLFGYWFLGRKKV